MGGGGSDKLVFFTLPSFITFQAVSRKVYSQISIGIELRIL
jgi:hypothetical protein